MAGSAMSAEEALEAIPETGAQVVLLDLELPGMDGLAFLKIFKPRHPQIEVLILTTFDDETKVYQAVRAGAAGYLVKRIAHEKIAAAIHEVWDGGTVIEARIARRFWNYFQSVKSSTREETRHGLTEVEIEILLFLGKGLSNAEVGDVMSMGRRTVRSHLSHIYRKLGVSTHVEAVVEALRLGLIDL